MNIFYSMQQQRYVSPAEAQKMLNTNNRQYSNINAAELRGMQNVPTTKEYISLYETPMQIISDAYIKHIELHKEALRKELDENRFENNSLEKYIPDWAW